MERSKATAWLDRVEAIAKAIPAGDPRQPEAKKIIERVAIARRTMRRGLPVGAAIIGIQQLMNEANRKVIDPAFRDGLKANRQRRQNAAKLKALKAENKRSDLCFIREALLFVKSLKAKPAAKQILDRLERELLEIKSERSMRREIGKLRRGVYASLKPPRPKDLFKQIAADRFKNPR